MIALIKKAIPRKIRSGIISALWKSQLWLSPSAKRPFSSGETSKAKSRREREGFFEKYCSGKGIDIGYGGDPVTSDCDVWDAEHGDAQTLPGVRDASYDFVYSSHTLEHMLDPSAAVQNWWRVLKPGGFLILYIPDRDLYEKKTTLPSRWNEDHKAFFLLERDEEPDTVGMMPMIHRVLSNFEIAYAKRCSEGHTINDPSVHSDGEYSIEAVVRKIR